MAVMGPAECFSLVCRSVADVTAKSRTNGHNLLLLLLFRVVLSQRSLAFAHSSSDTLALVTYITSTYQAAKLEQAAQYLEAAFHVPAAALDIAARVKVCPPFSGLACVCV